MAAAATLCVLAPRMDTGGMRIWDAGCSRTALSSAGRSGNYGSETWLHLNQMETVVALCVCVCVRMCVRDTPTIIEKLSQCLRSHKSRTKCQKAPAEELPAITVLSVTTTASNGGS
uniref:Uncharacterized protein n=1 Tax=Eutreptiella gymnastica TaxID=73025 RepID=A0A7S4FTZ7_9EUGL|mmetsp:Transcript_24108/g.41532  ORF Transcript_24108/g.41532 Transcript_24108/m.41532 type:complete len:116 (+) Transcript_24108:776-1123(+)